MSQSSAAPAAKSVYLDPKASISARVADLLSRMTLEEKVAQLTAVYNRKTLRDFFDPDHGFAPRPAAEALTRGVGEISMPCRELRAKASAQFMNAVQKHAIEKSRLKVPVLAHEEALHGHAAPHGTSFPQALALGSTWNPELIERIFASIAKEIRARGCTHVLTPVVDVARDPRFGRTEEMYGEDPHLVSRMAVAAVRGLQGDVDKTGRIDSEHVIATLKHFAAHGEPMGGLNGAPPQCSERTVREVFLPPFEAAVKEAGVLGVMPAYNEIDGVPCHSNRQLLNKTLREEWGFDGIIVSDYNGVDQLRTNHGTVATNEQAALKAFKAGVDLELPEGLCYPSLVQAVKQGQVSEKEIDQAVSRILRMKFMLGLFETPYVNADAAEQVVNSPAHQQLALEAARQAVVLLKNESNLLPLDAKKLRSIAVIGPNAAECHLGGYSTTEAIHTVSILQGIQQRVGPDVQVRYALGCKIVETDAPADNLVNVAEGDVCLQSNSGAARPSDPAADAVRIAEAVAVAKTCDVAIVVVGGNELICREGWKGRIGDRADLNLMGQQDELVKAVLATGKPVIVVLIHGRPNSINLIAEQVPAILEGWYLGQATGTAVAEVLFGDYNPGGKLSISIPRSVGHLPAYYNKKPSAVKDIYYFTSNAPLFAFGHGLSYTTFAYSDLTVTPARATVGQRVQASVRVTNTGSRAGDEVVQLYVRDLLSSVTRPVQELKAFKRVTLKAGESRTVQLELSVDQLAFYDEQMQKIVEPGTFEIRVGGSSEAGLTAQFEVTERA